VPGGFEIDKFSSPCYRRLSDVLEFGGQAMQRFSKMLVYAVLLCLLLPWASGKARLPHFSRAGNQMKREKPLTATRLRRWRNGTPGHHPIRPATAAILPPEHDDDDGDPERLSWRATHECLPALHTEQASQCLSLLLRSRPPSHDVPLHQAFCLLLI
jgi:hypothetical protein